MSSWVEIDPFAIIQNVKTIRQTLGDAPIWAVVKANAYGHDLKIAAEALWRAGIAGWVVTEPRDALWLSEERFKLPVLLTQPIEEALFPYACQHNWHLGVTSLSYFELIEHFVTRSEKRLTVHLEIETGMHRTGISPVSAEFLLAKHQKQKGNVVFGGLYTHLYRATDETISQKQIQEMLELQFSLQRKDLKIPPTHVLASDGAALYDQAFDAFRLGKALYGFCPHFAETVPALCWKTTIISLDELMPGDTVGYDATYKATRPLRTAILPVGYSDGLDQRLSNKGNVLIDGKRCPIVGLISMNHAVVDVTGVFKTEVGEEVVLLGQQKGAEIKLADITEWTGILDYEFVSRINPKIKRLKKQG